METSTQDLFATPVTPELAAKHIQAVSSYHGKNAKLTWNRKIKKMKGLIDELAVFEERILNITLEKQPVLDEIAELRNEMVKECIHPKDHVYHAGTFLVCKFCNKNISIPRILPSAPIAEEPEVEDVSDSE